MLASSSLTSRVVEEGCDGVDPITLILAALAAGVSAGIGDTASNAVKDAHGGVEGLGKKRFGGCSKAEGPLADHEAGPGPFGRAVAKQLEAVGAQADPEILQKAEELLRRADKDGIRTKYNVQ